MAANVISMFSVKETPWHGMGKVIQEAPTAAEAIISAGLDWKVLQAQDGAMIDGVFIPHTGFLQNYRSSDRFFFGTAVSVDYKVIQNNEAFDFLDNLVGEALKYETAGCLYNGRVWLLARLPSCQILDDDYDKFLLLTHTHDGMGSIRVAVVYVRVVCQNTLNLALRNARRSWSTRHKGDIGSKMADARETLKLSVSYHAAFVSEAENLAIQKISKTEFKVFIETLFPNKKDASKREIKNIEDQREKFRSIYEETPDLDNFRGTKWGVYQAVADFEGHKKPLRPTKTYQDIKLSTYASGNDFMDRAYEILKA
jgi:phage/plasmid-like protein (TIGR03299 family)